VHLSNCLLSGAARRLRGELGVPVACSLQDEDTWIDAMGEGARAAAWSILAGNAAHVDVFMAVSRYYAGFMADRMRIPPGRIRVVPIGIDVQGLDPAPSGLPFDPPVIGFLSRLCERMGVGLLADAFVQLAESAAFPGLRLRLTGGGTRADAAVVRSLRRALARRGLLPRVDVVREFGPQDRARFLRSLTVLSVPAPKGEAFGTFLLEAMACGVPVVQPRAGGFTELVEETGGGLLYDPDDPAALAGAIGSLLSDRARAAALAAEGRESVLSRYTAAHMAGGMERALVQAGAPRGAGA
jgi:glycosyltransferase involved in cell wall biosynthesis